jgi:SAM-dependent methyltransferase
MPPLPKEIRARLTSRGPRDHVRMLQRWHGTPFAAVEAHVPRAGTIVDAGCGFGMFAAVLAIGAPERRVVGLDLDGRKIARARELFGPFGTFVEGDLADAPLPACRAVVLYDVLHHLRDPVVERVLAAAYARLEPGGTLVVKENDVAPLWKRGISELVETVAVGSGLTRSDPWRFRSRDAWVRAIEAAGFRVTLATALASPGYGRLLPHSLFVASR